MTIFQRNCLRVSTEKYKFITSHTSRKVAILTAKLQNTRLFPNKLKNLLEKRDSRYFLIIMRRITHPCRFKTFSTQATTVTFPTSLTVFIRLITGDRLSVINT